MAKEQVQRKEAKMVYARKKRRQANAERYSKAEAKAIISDMISRRGK